MTDRKFYKVTWVIDIAADSAHAAARKALEIQRNPDSIATLFDVTDYASGATMHIDLLERADVG